ncbi:helix-turn-helix domain-containing protein [Amycolatopsis sp. NPDC049691]|uniref:helix-turn-helix transcriptional regulator n=1 Tax=Amycolatopsis sp. NPDC049691 TaxID=3155155 RepID=UPI00344184A5
MVSIRRREELVSARKAAGLTQEKLAEVMCVDRSTVIRWEAGEYAPLPYQWPKLAKVLGRSADELRELIGRRLPKKRRCSGRGLTLRSAGWIGTSGGPQELRARESQRPRRRGRMLELRPGGVSWLRPWRATTAIRFQVTRCTPRDAVQF